MTRQSTRTPTLLRGGVGEFLGTDPERFANSPGISPHDSLDSPERAEDIDLRLLASIRRRFNGNITRTINDLRNFDGIPWSRECVLPRETKPRPIGMVYGYNPFGESEGISRTSRKYDLENGFGISPRRQLQLAVTDITLDYKG